MDSADGNLLMRASGLMEETRALFGPARLTALGIGTVPLMVELAKFGATFDPETAAQLPSVLRRGGGLAPRLEELRREHLDEEVVGPARSLPDHLTCVG